MVSQRFMLQYICWTDFYWRSWYCLHGARKECLLKYLENISECRSKYFWSQLKIRLRLHGRPLRSKHQSYTSYVLVRWARIKSNPIDRGEFTLMLVVLQTGVFKEISCLLPIHQYIWKPDVFKWKPAGIRENTSQCSHQCEHWWNSSDSIPHLVCQVTAVISTHLFCYILSKPKEELKKNTYTSFLLFPTFCDTLHFPAYVT